MIERVKVLAEIDISPLLELAEADHSGLDLVFYKDTHEERVTILPGLYMYASYSNSFKMRFFNRTV